MTTSEIQTSTPGLSAAARRLLEQRLRGRAVADTGIPRLDPRPATAPLSPAQQGIYFLDQLEPGGTEYLMPAAWRLTGPLDVAALDAAVGDLVHRHEQLRVVFPSTDGVPAQRVLPGGNGLAHLDLTGRGPDVAGAVHDLATAPFDLAAEPSFRPTLVRVADDEHVLVFAMHHVVTDGWSLDVLVRDLQEFYRVRLAGGAPALPLGAVAYTDYAVWQRSAADTAQGRDDLEHWRAALSGITPLELPTDHPRPETRSHAAAVHAGLDAGAGPL